MARQKGGNPDVENRWWVDHDRNHDRAAGLLPGSRPPLGLFRCGEGYDPSGARERLSGTNLKLLADARPPEGGWGYVALLEERSPRAEVERVRAAIALPRGARGVIVDSGTSLRVLVTGTPHGERLVELRLGEMSSFDCWIHQEWVREEEWEGTDEALARAPALIREYLITTRFEPLV